MAENNKQTIAVSSSALIFVGLIIVALVGFGGYMYGKVGTLEKGTTTTTAQPATGQQAAAQQQAQPQVSLDVVKGVFGKNVIKFGDANKKLLLVEVSDPSCPYCHVAGGDNKDIGAQMGAQFKSVADGGSYVPPVTEMRKLVDSGKASFAWIYSPGHGSGITATKAFYCAFEKGKFWAVHDLIMSSAGYTLMNTTLAKGANGGALDDAANQTLVVDFLKSAIDSKFLKDCLASNKYDSVLTENTALATSLGVQGTPGFFVNSTNFAGAYSWTDMKSVADAALK